MINSGADAEGGLDRQKLSRNEGGFTVTELLFTLFIILITFSTFLSITSAVNQTSAKTEDYLAANSVAFAKIQEYETKSFDAITVGVPANNFEVEDFSSSINGQVNNELINPRGKVFVSPESSSLKKIRVTVTFSDIGKDRTIEYATFIQVGGVGR